MSTPISDDITAVEPIEVIDLDAEAPPASGKFVGILMLDNPHAEGQTIDEQPSDDAEIVDVDLLTPGDTEPVEALLLPDGVEPSAAVIGTSEGDILYSSQERLIVVGLAGDDLLFSTTVGSTLYGGDGYDLLQSERGGDRLIGGADPDMFLLWCDTMEAPSHIVDFSGDDMLVLGGQGGVIEQNGNAITLNGRAIVTFENAAVALSAAMFWLT